MRRKSIKKTTHSSGSVISSAIKTSSQQKKSNWTPEEMAQAKPLPIPTTPDTPVVTHLPAGTGQTSSGGKPEKP
jgi:hypothetical protein